MISFLQFMTVIAVSIDGFCIGFALGFAEVKLNTALLAFMGFMSTVLCFITMKLGSLLFGVVSNTTCDLLSASIFFFLSYMALKPQKKSKKHLHLTRFSAAFLGGTAVAVDASIAAFGLAADGGSIIILPLLFGIAHFLFISLGYFLASSPAAAFIRRKIPSVSAILLSALGCARLM